jgi:tetratricopeptide (TPR) repeat protein
VAPAPVPEAPAKIQAHVYKLPAEPDAAARPAEGAESRAAQPVAPAGASLVEAATAAPTPAQRYRAALDLIAKKEYAKAILELNDAIAQDPRLAVAYAARASAQFGIGRYREAADDYRASLDLNPELGTPLYGLAECYRLLGDPGAAEMYARYAESRAPDVREDLRALAQKRAYELSGR